MILKGKFYATKSDLLDAIKNLFPKVTDCHFIRVFHMNGSKFVCNIEGCLWEITTRKCENGYLITHFVSDHTHVNCPHCPLKFQTRANHATHHDREHQQVKFVTFKTGECDKIINF